MGLDKFALLGHSLGEFACCRSMNSFPSADAARLQTEAMLTSLVAGAAVATLVAGAIPERIERLCLVEGFGPIIGTAESTADSFSSLMAAERLLSTKRKPIYATIDDAIKV
jgi:pimeloyl-ACP methyl ester carboxylesterase